MNKVLTNLAQNFTDAEKQILVKNLTEILKSVSLGNYYWKPSVSDEGTISWELTYAAAAPDAVNIRGPQGEQGETGATGKDGTSPDVTITAIEGGHHIVCTTVNGTQEFDVLDGAQGETGETPKVEVSPDTTPEGDVRQRTISITTSTQTVSTTVRDGAQGPKGEDGAGINLAGSVTSYADLSSLTNLTNGDGYLVKDTGLLYIYTGTWPAENEGIAFQGPQGEKGDKGDTGPKGEQGADGAAGKDGITPTIAISEDTAAGTHTLTINGVKPGESIAETVTVKIADGKAGDKGDSAYDIAVKNGYAGTETEWLSSLKGNTGATGPAGQYTNGAGITISADEISVNFDVLSTRYQAKGNYVAPPADAGVYAGMYGGQWVDLGKQYYSKSEAAATFVHKTTMSAYQPKGDYATSADLANKIDTSAVVASYLTSADAEATYAKKEDIPVVEDPYTFLNGTGIKLTKDIAEKTLTIEVSANYVDGDYIESHKGSYSGGTDYNAAYMLATNKSTNAVTAIRIPGALGDYTDAVGTGSQTSGYAGCVLASDGWRKMEFSAGTSAGFSRNDANRESIFSYVPLKIETSVNSAAWADDGILHVVVEG